MRLLAAILSGALMAGLGGCAAPGTAEDFKWALDVPKQVDKGTEFHLKVTASRSTASAEGVASSEEVDGMPFQYQIHWTGGSSAPLRHKGWTGEPVKVRARMVPGPATVLVTSANKDGLEVKVAEATVEVK